MENITFLSGLTRSDVTKSPSCRHLLALWEFAVNERTVEDGWLVCRESLEVTEVSGRADGEVQENSAVSSTYMP